MSIDLRDRSFGQGIVGYIGRFTDYASLPGAASPDAIAFVDNATGSRWTPFISTYRASGWYIFQSSVWVKTNPILDADDDTTLAADSSVRVPTQHAVKTYVDSVVTGTQTQTHIVTAGEVTSGIIIGLTTINSLVKVELVNDGTVLIFTLTTPTSMTLDAQGQMFAGQNLLIWHT